MNTILLAADGSPSAARATREAVELAKATGASLRVVAVWGILSTPYLYTAPPVLSDVAVIERERAEKTLDAAVARANAEGVSALPILRRGDAANEICAVAGDIRADLIVIGAHGWNPFRRFFLGSVSTRVLHHAPCPVLIARGDAATAAHKPPTQTAVTA